MQGRGSEGRVVGRRRGAGLPLLVLALAGWGLAPVARAVPVVSLVTGEIEQISVDTPGDVWSGGKVVVGGQVVILPRNLLMDLPANRLTVQQLFATAPPACVARGESGLAKTDGCNFSGVGGFATITANRTNGGDVIAGDVYLQKSVEVVSGTVSFIDFTQGYFRVNGIAGSATTGVMVRINDPGARQTVQSGLGCADGPNCSPDPRFTHDPDNYTSSFSTGYPLCLPSTVARPFVDVLDFNANGNRTETLTAQASATGAGDLLCPSTNRPTLTTTVVADSRRFAPILPGDHVESGGSFETVGGVRFFSAWRTKVSRALTTQNLAGQPDYVTVSEMFIEAPGFNFNRIRDLFLGYSTSPVTDVVLLTEHRDPLNNAVHEFPIGSVVGCDVFAGAGTCAGALGPQSFRVRHDAVFGAGAAKSTKLSACGQLRNDPRYATKNVCPNGGTDAEEFSILSPLPRQVVARTGLKIADNARVGGPLLRTLDIGGHDAPNGQFVFPMGINLGGVEPTTFAELNIDALATATLFEGMPWTLDRRLSVSVRRAPS